VLEAAARKRAGRTLTDEIVGRLRHSFVNERDARRDRAARGFCYLLAETVADLSIGFGSGVWRSDPFIFRTVKLAFGQMMEELEPKGELRSPIKQIENAVPGSYSFSPGLGFTWPSDATPEELASFVRAVILSSLKSTSSPPEGWGNAIPSEAQQELNYGMADARRDLLPQLQGDKS
jgi:hypothetical protein